MQDALVAIIPLVSAVAFTIAVGVAAWGPFTISRDYGGGAEIG